LSAPAPPDVEALVRRLRTLDTPTLERTATTMGAARQPLSDAQRTIHGVVTNTQEVWSSRDRAAWVRLLDACVAKLVATERAVGEMAASLRQINLESAQARKELEVFDRLAADAYMGAPGSPNLDVARYARAAADIYHAAERRVRLELWDLGDTAPVGEAPVPPLPLTPRPSRWESLLFGPSGFYEWSKGPDGRPMGVDEDGGRVPAHRGRPEFIEIRQLGIGGLLRRVPKIGRRLKVGPQASLKELTKAFADDIANSYGWRPRHIDRHIREWYHLGRKETIPGWMRTEFLQKTARAAASSGKVIPAHLAGEPTHALLHFDQSTKRYLVVHFHAGGKYADEFASAFAPSKAQVDALLRRAATVRGN
jgi:hypothetical protein